MNATPLLQQALEALERSLNWLSSYPGGGTMSPSGPYEQTRAAITAIQAHLSTSQAVKDSLTTEQIDAAWDEFWGGSPPLTSIDARRGWARHIERIVTKEQSNAS